jgi:hypothetical protein
MTVVAVRGRKFGLCVVENDTKEVGVEELQTVQGRSDLARAFLSGARHEDDPVREGSHEVSVCNAQKRRCVDQHDAPALPQIVHQRRQSDLKLVGRVEREGRRRKQRIRP